VIPVAERLSLLWLRSVQVGNLKASL